MVLEDAVAAADVRHGNWFVTHCAWHRIALPDEFTVFNDDGSELQLELLTGSTRTGRQAAPVTDAPVGRGTPPIWGHSRDFVRKRTTGSRAFLSPGHASTCSTCFSERPQWELRESHRERSGRLVTGRLARRERGWPHIPSGAAGWGGTTSARGRRALRPLTGLSQGR